MDASSFKPIVTPMTESDKDTLSVVRQALADRCRAIIIDCAQRVIVVHPDLDAEPPKNELNGDSLMYLLSVTRVIMLDGLWSPEEGVRRVMESFSIDAPTCIFCHVSRDIDLEHAVHKTKHLDRDIVMVLKQTEQSVGLYGFTLEEL